LGPHGHLLDLAGLQAGGTDPDALGRAVHQGAHALDVGVPAALGAPVGVADRHTERGMLAAHLADRGHPLKIARQLALVVVATLESLDAAHLREVVLGYRDALRAHQEKLNRLNVYPVPDGDTGTNMALTLESVVSELDGADDMGTTCKAI